MSPPTDNATPGDGGPPPKRTPQDKFIVMWEAVKRSLLSAEILLKSMYAELDGITCDHEAGKVIEDRAAAPLITCLGFIDFAFRFKSLMDDLPMVSGRHPGMVRVQKALESVEAARHHLQHLRQELATNDAVDYPILGSISWLAATGTYTMALGATIGVASFTSLTYDTIERRWTATHVYKVRDVVVDLDAVIVEMRMAYNTIAAGIQPADSPLKELKWGTTFVFKWGIQPIAPASTASGTELDAPRPS